MRYALPALAALACALTACQPQPISQADQDAIKASSQVFNTNVNAGNADALADLFTPDATVQPSGMPAAVGTAAIKKLFSDMMAPMRFNLTSTVTKVEGQGDVAYAVGTYHIVYTMKDGTQAPPPEDGHWMGVLWRQADKSWKWKTDTWSANAPPTAPAPAPANRSHR